MMSFESRPKGLPWSLSTFSARPPSPAARNASFLSQEAIGVEAVAAVALVTTLEIAAEGEEMKEVKVEDTV